MLDNLEPLTIDPYQLFPAPLVPIECVDPAMEGGMPTCTPEMATGFWSAFSTDGELVVKTDTAVSAFTVDFLKPDSTYLIQCSENATEVVYQTLLNVSPVDEGGNVSVSRGEPFSENIFEWQNDLAEINRYAGGDDELEINRKEGLRPTTMSPPNRP
jgi:hypothetical protein